MSFLVSSVQIGAKADYFLTFYAHYSKQLFPNRVIDNSWISFELRPFETLIKWHH